MKLTDRVVLVTGGARRVGRAIAMRLAQSGAQMAVHYHTSADEAAETVALCRQAGRRAEALAADLRDPAAAVDLVAEVRARFGRLDVLVNNASVFDRMTLEGFDLAAWEQRCEST